MREFNFYDDVRLVTQQEWENIVSCIPNVPVEVSFGWWTASNTDHLGKGVFVTGSGDLSVCDPDVVKGIRPLFKVKSASGLHTGEKVNICGALCTVVDVYLDPSEFYALADVALTVNVQNGWDRFLHSERFKRVALGIV